MDYAVILAAIENQIVPNANNEITADVLRPILIDLLNFTDETVGDLTDLSTSDNSNVVSAINELKSAIDNINEVVFLTGMADPNVSPPPTYEIGDFYIQLDGLNNPINLYIYNGVEWFRFGAPNLEEVIAQGGNIGVSQLFNDGNGLSPYATLDDLSGELEGYVKLNPSPAISQTILGDINIGGFLNVSSAALIQGNLGVDGVLTVNENISASGLVTSNTANTDADAGITLIRKDFLTSKLSTKADLVDGKVPASQLPSYVDDVMEFANFAAFPVTGESGKIYVALDTNLTYRWGGSSYVEISPSLALGETSSTAYRGDRGKIAYDHSQTTGNPHNTQIGDISGLTSALNSKANDTDVVHKAGAETITGTKTFAAPVEIQGTNYIGFASTTWTISYGSGGLNFTKQGTGNALFIKDNLYVGFGTNNPQAKIDIYDDATGDLIAGRVGSLGVQAFTIGGFNTDTVNAGMYFKTQKAGVMTQAMRISPDGNVTIGANITPHRFNVSNNGNEGLEVALASNPDQRIVLQNYDRTGLAYKPIHFEASLFKFGEDSGANVIIGGTSSSSKLSVQNGTGGNQIEMIRGTGRVLFGMAASTNDLILYSGASGSETLTARFFEGGSAEFGGSIPLILYHNTGEASRANGLYFRTDNSGYKLGIGKDVSGTKTDYIQITDNGVVDILGAINVPTATASGHAINKGQYDSGLSLKANTDGSNATGSWGIDITGTSVDSEKLGGIFYNDSYTSDIDDFIIRYGGEFRPIKIVDAISKLGVAKIRQNANSLASKSMGAHSSDFYLAITVNGAVVGDRVDLVLPASIVGSGLTQAVQFYGYVSAADTVTIKVLNMNSSSVTVPTFNIDIIVLK